MMNFNEALRILRVCAGLTQRQLADMLELDRSSYTYYETGKSTPTVPALKRLSNLYGVSMDTMTGESEEALQREIEASCRMRVLAEAGPRVRRILLQTHGLEREEMHELASSVLELWENHPADGGTGVALCRENRYNSTHDNRPCAGSDFEKRRGSHQ